MAAFESLSPLLAAVKANSRLRLGVLAIVAIAWLYGLLLLRDEIGLAAGEYQAVSKKLARVQLQATQTGWIARVEPARSAQLELESKLWRESTVGLAQAAFQDWLNQAVQQANLTRVSVAVGAQEETVAGKNAASSTETDTTAGLWKVTAKISFDFTPKGLYSLLGRLEGYDKQIVVESVVVRGTPSPRAEMVLVAFFQRPAPANQPGEPPAGARKQPAETSATRRGIP